VTNVLIADNDRAVSGLLADVLLRLGVRSTQAHDGMAARRELARGSVDLLVCDLDMPGAGGLEVVEALVAEARPPHVIVVSGYVDAEVERRLAALPMVRAVLRKPFDLLRFADLVRTWLREPRGARERFADAGGGGDASL
jgi:CheY-like chemotaxis protein